MKEEKFMSGALEQAAPEHHITTKPAGDMTALTALPDDYRYPVASADFPAS